jgi:hypothetical protein
MDRSSDRVSLVMSAAHACLDVGLAFPSACVKALPEHLRLNHEGDDMRARPFLARRFDHAPRYVEHGHPAGFEVLLDARRKPIAQSVGCPVEEKLALAPHKLEVLVSNENMLLADLAGTCDEPRREDETAVF